MATISPRGTLGVLPPALRRFAQQLYRAGWRLTEHDGGTRMEVRSVFDSREHMDQLVRMGAADVFVQTVGQMDALIGG